MGGVRDHDRLRGTFDSTADLYARARPDYPEALFDELTTVTELRPGDHLLEVGCATGKATLPLAKRGFRMTCVEFGPNLAATAMELLSRFAEVTIVRGDFETWVPQADVRFDLVFAATAWHWIDPAVRYTKAWTVLREGGHLAVWSAAHVFPENGDPFFSEIQEIYDEIGEGLPSDARWPRPGELDEHDLERDSGGLFERVAVRHFDWEILYDAQGYIDLLDTFSGHIAMEDWQRDRLYDEIRRRLAARPDGRLRRHWGAVLEVARRRS